MKNYLRSQDRGKLYPIRRKNKHTWVNFSKATESPNISRVACAVWRGRDKVITDMTTPMGVMPGMSIILFWNSRITASSSSLQATTGTGLCLCYNMYILGRHLRGLRFVVASEWALLSLLNTTTTTTSLPQRHCNKYLRGRCVCVSEFNMKTECDSCVHTNRWDGWYSQLRGGGNTRSIFLWD